MMGAQGHPSEQITAGYSMAPDKSCHVLTLTQEENT